MANFLDYIDWRGDISLSAAKLNVIDICAISQIALINLDDIIPGVGSGESITIKDAYSQLTKKDKQTVEEIGLIIPNYMVPMLKKMSTAKRFKNLKLSNYVNDVDVERQVQFCAMTLGIDDDTEIVIFSGTDDTIIGWKENFNMIYQVTSGQSESLKYLRKIFNKDKKYILCGHSKGGNLTIYSLTHCDKEIEENIIKAVALDGPGLTEDVSQIPDFNERIKKLVSIIPQTSVVGRLFDHYEKTIIVHSVSNGVYQHDAFSWQVLGKSFIEEPNGLSHDAIQIEKKVKEVLSTMDDENRKAFCEILYNLLGGSNVKTLTELNQRRSLLLKNYFGINAKGKKEFNKIFSELILDKAILKNVFLNISQFNKFKEIDK